MKESVSRIRSHLLLIMLLCAAGCFLLTAHAPSAHALFTTDVHLTTAHAMQAFPTGLSVDADGYKARGAEIDRDQLTVTATYSDGTTRVLDADEYELSPAAFPAGHKGDFDTDIAYAIDGHEVTASAHMNADEAYGAQYGDVLVFGRGIPADTYQDKSISNTTWGIEESGCSPRWSKGVLTSIVDIDTVRPVSMSNWFNHSGSLRSVVLDQMDTSRITDLSFLFYEDSALQVADVSKWDVSHVTTIERMFSWCSSLPSLNLSAWNTASLTNMALAFNRMSVLTTTGSLAGWNVSNVTTFGNTFDLCYKLKSIGDVSGWNTGKVTNFYCTFANCYELTGVNCRKWNVNNATTHFDFDRNAPGVTAPSW